MSEIKEEHFMICDTCLCADDTVILMDCQCGRSICKHCASKELKGNSSILIENEDLKLWCCQCIRQEKFCWFCRLSDGDIKEPLINCKECFISYHMSCLQCYGLNSCPLHSCFSCGNTLKEVENTCYVCLRSYCPNCFKGVLLDSEERINACVCQECCDNFIHCSSLMVDCMRIINYLNEKRLYKVILSPVIFILQEHLFNDAIDEFLNMHHQDIVESYNEGKSFQEEILSYITILLNKKDNNYYILNMLLQLANYENVVVIDNFEIGFAYKVGLVFKLFLYAEQSRTIKPQVYLQLYSQNMLRLIEKNNFEKIEQQYMQYQEQEAKGVEAAKEVKLEAGQKEQEIQEPQPLEEAEIGEIERQSPKQLKEFVFNGSSYETKYDNIFLFFEENSEELIEEQKNYPWRAFTDEIKIVLQNKIYTKMLSKLIFFNFLQNTPLLKLLVLCDAITLYNEYKLQQLTPFIGQKFISEIVLKVQELQKEPVQKAGVAEERTVQEAHATSEQLTASKGETHSPVEQKVNIQVPTIKNSETTPNLLGDLLKPPVIESTVEAANEELLELKELKASVERAVEQNTGALSLGEECKIFVYSQSKTNNEKANSEILQEGLQQEASEQKSSFKIEDESVGAYGAIILQ